MSTPDNHGKKAPQFAAFKPLTTVQNANDCCCGLLLCRSLPDRPLAVSLIKLDSGVDSRVYPSVNEKKLNRRMPCRLLTITARKPLNLLRSNR